MKLIKLYYRYLRYRYTKRQIAYQTILASSLIFWIMIFFLMSCSPIHSVIHVTGTAIECQENELLVLWPEKDKKNSYSWTWVSYPCDSIPELPFSFTITPNPNGQTGNH